VPQLRVLTVCTANVCRSPVAERFLAVRLRAAGWAGASSVSAGTRGGELPVHNDTLVAASAVGIDLSDHRSRALSPEIIRDEGADLVVAMAREHMRHVVALDPTAWPRTFTLKELVRRGIDAGPLGAQPLDAWLHQLGDGRRAADSVRPDAADDIHDPYGGPARGHAAMVAEIDELTDLLARLLRQPI